MSPCPSSQWFVLSLLTFLLFCSSPLSHPAALSNSCLCPMFAFPSLPPLLCPVLLLLIPSKGCSSVQGHRLPLSSSVDPSPLYDWGQRLSPWWLTSRWEALLSGHGVVYNANMHNRVIYNVRGMRRRPFTATLIFRSGYEPRQTQ